MTWINLRGSAWRPTNVAAGERTCRWVVDGRMEAGEHEITFDAADLPSGVYLYRLVTTEKTLSPSMHLLTTGPGTKSKKER